MFGGLPTLARVKQPLFDVTASLSLACDLAHGAEPERQLKVAVLAARMAEECGLSNEEPCTPGVVQCDNDEDDNGQRVSRLQYHLQCLIDHSVAA